jgi:hypothetical protein
MNKNSQASMPKADEQPGAPVTGGSAAKAACNDDLTVELKRHLEDSRLPASLKEEILAKLPSPEEQERLYRELQENGGLSFTQFLDSIGILPRSGLSAK